jgi:hypothetical protein
MTTNSKQQPDRNTPRRAHVALRDGRHYVCWAWIADGLIHAHTVRRRIGDSCYGELGDRTWSRGALREIRWDDESCLEQAA